MKRLRNSPNSEKRTLFLVGQAQRGEPNALQRLMSHCQPRIRAMVRAQMGSKLRTNLESSDLTQEVNAKLRQAIHTFRRQRCADSFDPWLRTVVSNRIRDEARKLNRKPDLLPTSTAIENTPSVWCLDPALQKKDDCKLIRAAMRQLPHNLREIVQLKYFRQLSFREISVRLSLSEMTAWRLHRVAIARLLVLARKLDLDGEGQRLP